MICLLIPHGNVFLNFLSGFKSIYLLGYLLTFIYSVDDCWIHFYTQNYCRCMLLPATSLNAFLTTYGFGNHCLTVYGIVIVFITTIELRHCDVFERNDSSRQKQLSLGTNCFFLSLDI